MSNSDLYRPGQCNETAGFLFSHVCSEPSEYVCAECQKPVCGKHVVDTQGTLRCTSCAKKWFRTSRRVGTSDDSSMYDPYYGNPYFYTWHHFGPTYHHHHHHFHDSDEDAVRGRAPGRDDVEGFEQDMGAS